MSVIAPARRESSPVRGTVSDRLLVAYTVASAGGPLALAGLLAPQAVTSLRSIGLLTLVAVAFFALPVYVWWRYSESVVSAGGLFSFVEAAAGRRVAFLQGAVWIVSYALYLPYTIVYLVYDLLPVVAPGVRPYRTLLEIGLPSAIALLGAVRVRAAVQVMAGIAVAQIVVLVLLSLSGLGHVGAASNQFAPHGPVGSVARGAANVSLLFVCSSLTLFLGAEARGGSRSMQKAVPLGVGISAAALLIGVLPLARASRSVLDAPIPGVALARDAWGHPFSVIVGLGIVISVGGVVISEYLALTRVLHVMSARPLAQTSLVVATFFVGASAIALVNPDAFYADLVKPSLVALWVSQFVVFAVYPRLAARQGRALPGAVAVALAASALVGYGFYSAITYVSGT